jgi:hypothetical protein
LAAYNVRLKTSCTDTMNYSTNSEKNIGRRHINRRLSINDKTARSYLDNAHKTYRNVGDLLFKVGDGNRTHVTSLEGCENRDVRLFRTNTYNTCKLCLQ